MNLSDFKILEKVGHGGMGSVYRAAWESPGGPVPVALKFLRAGDREGADRHLLREARAAARVCHPNIVTLLDAGRVASELPQAAAGAPYLVMEWVEGETLSQRPPGSWREVLSITKTLLDALGHAHGWGVLHRDLKPPNVLRCADDTLKLADFGIGRVLDVVDDPTIQPGKVIGSPAFMAPEQVEGRWRDESPATDVYGLGTLIWWLVTGNHLFQGDPVEVMLAQVRERVPALKAQFDVPYGIRNWLYTALEKRPENRFQSAAEARAALDEIQDSERTSRYPVVRPGRASANVEVRLTPPQRHTTDDHAVSSDLRAAGLGVFALRTPPIFGREVEKELMWNAYRRVARLERAEVLFVHGASGSGKSALASWLGRRIREGGYGPVLHSTFEDTVQGESALIHAVRRWFGLSGLDADAALVRVTEKLTALGFERADTVAQDFIARSYPGFSERRGLQEPTQWHAFLLKFVEALEGPVLWIIDDIHVNEASRAFIEAAGTAESALLVVATTQSSVVPDVTRSQMIAAGRLRASAMRELVHSLLPLDPTLTDRVVARAEGSPMFAIQLLEDWVARGVLEPGPLGYRAGDEAVEGLPADIHEVWQQRLRTVLGDRADDSVWDALRVAALYGQRMPTRRWRAACSELGIERPEEVADAVIAAGLLRITAQDTEFAHSLLHESVLQGASTPVRHLAIVKALEAEDPTPRVLERAARHLWAAGEQLSALDRMYAALVKYDEREEDDTVILLVPLIEEWAVAAGEGMNLCLADSLVRFAKTQRRRAGPLSALASIDRAEAIAMHGHSEQLLYDQPDALRNRVMAEVYIGRSHIVDATSDEDALVFAERALRVAQAGGCSSEAATAAAITGDVLCDMGRYDDAQNLLVNELGDLDSDQITPRAAFALHNQLTDLYDLRGEYRLGLQAIDAAERYAEIVGDRSGLCYAWARRSDLLTYLGEFSEARTWAEKARQCYAERASWVEPVIRLSAAVVDACDGLAEDLVLTAGQLVAEFQDERLARYVGVALFLHALTLAANGDLEAAEETFAEAVERPRIVRESVILAAELAALNAGKASEVAERFVEEHYERLPEFYRARMNG